MMNDRIIIILFFVNIVIVTSYSVYSIIVKKEEMLTFLTKVVVMLVCPLAGALFFLIAGIAYRLYSHALNLEDVIFSKERVKVYLHADEERGRNIVSVEEALAVTDKMNLRNLIMNVVKGNVKESLGSISLALNGEDSETSHYAASVLQDELNDFRAHVQKEYNEIEKYKDTEFPVTRAIELLHFMNIMLLQKVFTEMEQNAMVKTMDAVAQLIYSYAKASMSSHDYEAICLRLLETEHYDRCKVWCDRSEQDYPDSLSTYTCKMKICYYTGEREELFRVMNKLKQTNIIIDKETLEIIRYFSSIHSG